MRDKVKRFISILMTALMLVNLMPVGALADGITSIGYKPETIANGNQTVYLYVKVTGNLNGLNLNKSGWCTVGKVTGLNMTDPQSYAWWYGSSNHVSSVSGISASSVGKGDVERYEKNQSIDLSKVTWASGTHYGFLPVSTGADDYVGSGWTWHLDGYIDIAQVQASYKIRYVDQDTNKVLQTAASGTDDPGVWIDHTAPKTLEGGYEIVGDTDRTFKLEQIDNTFDIYYRRPYGYTVEYYYDGVKNETVTGESQLCGTKINTYTPKPKVGYELDETKTTKLPLTIGTDESKNVIKVYYKKIGYTVTYKPGEHGTFKTQKHDAKHGDATPAFNGETTGDPGWTFDVWEPKVADTVTENATYIAKFVPDKTKTASVLYTISTGQSDYGSIAPSAQQIIFQATGKLDIEGGGSVSGSKATAKTGYKFAGWYKATGEATYERVTGDRELTSELAESKLNKDEKTGLYQNTVFEARFEPDEKQTATVTYTAENGTVTHASDTILQADASGLTGSTATPNPGYKFDGWYKGDERITTDLTLTPEMAKDKLDKDENGLYVNATFTAKCKLDEDQNATVLYTIFRGQSDYGSIAPAAQQIILQATGKLANGDPISGSMATANPGYKFVGWYKVTGEETYEKVTDDPELTSELAESELNRDEKTGLYRNTVFEARFELDAGAKVPVTYEAENGTLEGTTSQEAHIVTGDGLTDVEATPNKGYKFDGWYNGDERITTDLTLTPEKAKEKLNKDENGLYVNTTFTAKCKLDEAQNATVTYTIFHGQSDYGSIAPSAQQVILQATGKQANGNPISGSTATVKPGYKFVGWYKVTGWTTEWQTEWITDSPELTPELAEQNLTQNEQGLYQNTVFAAKFELDDYAYTVEHYWIGDKDNPDAQPFHTDADESQTAPYGSTVKYAENGASWVIMTNPVYTFAKADPEKITISADASQNVLKLYYYKNVKLIANSETNPYNGKEQHVSGYTCAVAEMKDGRLEYVPWTGEKPLTFEGISASGRGKDVNENGYPVTFNDTPIGEHDGLYYVNESQTGTLTIAPSPVTLQAPIASKTYDGTPLKAEDYGHSFVEGVDFADDFASISVEGSQTQAGSSVSQIKEVVPKKGKDLKNYKLTFLPGSLTVAKRSVLLTSQSATKTYDGSALTRPAVTITGDGFVPGELAKVEATGSITNVGSTPNAIQYTTTGAFNPANYSIALSVGTLTVTAKPEPEPRRTFNLTVNYVYQNGKRAAASYNRGGLKNGETFDITSPVIAGYTASETVVSGTIDNRDIKVTVIYTADGVNLDDYGVPLGLGNITMNVGDCFE